MTPEEAADISLGALLDRGFPMDQAAEWARCVKDIHEALADVRRLRESALRNYRASKRLLLLAGEIILCAMLLLALQLLT